MQKIIFFSVIDGVADAFPVAPAREFKFDWVANVKNSYKSKIEKHKHSRVAHLARCPGIFDLLNTGYIVPMPWDIAIETNGDLQNFKWHGPTWDLENLFNKNNSSQGECLISGQLANGIDEYLPSPPDTLNVILKINLPWNVIVPPGMKFMMIPIPYPDGFEFEQVIGILDPAVSSEINLQLRWKVTNGIHTIKAGTPMCQLIPITDEKFQLEVRNATDKDKQWLLTRRYLNSCTFFKNRIMISRTYNNFYNSIDNVKDLFKKLFGIKKD